MKFTELNLSPEMVEALKAVGYKDASPIQAEVIPYALKGRDIIGQAQTGTGKTAAFSIPIIEKTEIGNDLQHVILAPSRELATQIFTEIRKLRGNKDIKVTDIIGGISYTIQERNLKRNPNIIVATPGRFIDNMNKGLIKLDKIKSFTLDEADEMLNYGFLKEITKIADAMPKGRQTYFLTATFNKKIKELAKKLLNNPQEITVSSGMASIETIDQKYLVVKEKQKLHAFVSLMQMMKPKAAIVFGRTRRRVDELSAALSELGFSAIGIQGDMRQRERANAMQKFRDGKIEIIVGTDVLARGIDVDHVDFVFNFDLPEEIEYYTHRIGRTGRAGRKGTAVSFVKESELRYWDDIMTKTNSNADKWPIPTDKDLMEIRQHNLNDELKELLYGGQGKFDAVAKRIQEQFSYDQLAIIVANQIIGTQKSAHEIALTGENSNNRRNRGGGNRNGGGNRTRGGNRGSRSYSGNGGGSRGGYRGNDRRSNGGGDRRSSGGNDRRSNGGGDRRSSGGNDRRSNGGERRSSDNRNSSGNRDRRR